MELPAIGEMFEDRYELLAILGEGSFGCVFEAQDHVDQRMVALKILMPTDGEYSNTRAARFLREAHLLSDLRDPHTLRLYDFGQSADGLLFIATEVIEGEGLDVVLRRDAPLAEDVVVHILKQVLSAMAEAHDHELLHRDIKPENIIIHRHAGDPYHAKLLDFGLAKSLNSDATQLTAQGKIVGTPAYMSPEQCRGLDLTPQSDIYSLGLVTYEMLTGRPAILGHGVREIMMQHLKGDPLDVATASTPLREIVRRSTTRDIKRRPPDARALLAELAPATKPVPATQSPVASTRVWVLLAIGAVPIALILLAWLAP